jgi:hypothetical protein
MQYEHLNPKTAELFDHTLSNAKKDSIMQQMYDEGVSENEMHHISQAAAALTPAASLKASKTLKDNVMKQIQNDTAAGTPVRRIPLLRPTWKKIASIAAILLAALVVIPVFGPRLFNSNAKAMSLLNTSLEAILNIKTMIVSYQVRSVAGDNLDLIDTKGDFIDYKLYKEFFPTEKWRIEKPGLAVAMDGKNQYKYMEKAGIGYVGSPQSGFVDWMRILLDPARILGDEKTSASRHHAKYTLETKGNETILTVKAKARGDFKNTYLLNSSIPESDNRRVYHFDKLTSRLLSLEIYIGDKGKEIQVLKVNSIKYDETIAPETFSIALPIGTEWLALKELEPKKENGTLARNADEAARLWWEAFAKKDWSMAYKFDPSMEHSSGVEAFKEEYGGLQVIKIETAFKSGLYAGYFVPYTIKLPSGKVLNGKLAVRNDNEGKVWQIDGGY